MDRRQWLGSRKTGLTLRPESRARAGVALGNPDLKATPRRLLGTGRRRERIAPDGASDRSLVAAFLPNLEVRGFVSNGPSLAPTADEYGHYCFAVAQ
jgi:hypothetical protein